MEILQNIGLAFAICLYGFFLGSIPNGVIIGKLFFHEDPRNFGSHNSGGTNTGRTFGRKIGILVIALDLIKAVFSFWSVWAFLRLSGIRDTMALFDDGVFYNYLVLLAASLGHCFSPWLGFKGGKAVSCFMGATGGLGWVNFIVCTLAFFPIFLKKRIMSISTLFASVVITAFQWIMYLAASLSVNRFEFMMWNFGNNGGCFYGWEAAATTTAICIILFLRHSSNIQRIKEGKEEKLNWK